MKELLKFLVENIAAEKDKIKIIEKKEVDKIKYIIKVSKNDIKNLIGREGKMIKSIKRFVNMAAINKGIQKRIPIEIVDEY